MNLDKIESFPRKDVLLAYLASVPAGLFGITQIQKGMFLVWKNVPNVFETQYEFEAESYGPRAKGIHTDLDILMDCKLVKMVTDPASYTNVRDYLATPAGLKLAQDTILKEMNPKFQDYFRRLAEWVLEQTFTDLVRTVIQNHPEMGTNMIFQRGKE